MIADPADAGQVTRLLLCAGKVYYDLQSEIRQQPRGQIAVLRLEQLYPFPQQAILSHRAGVMGGIGGQTEGLDPDRSAFAMGQSAGGVRDVLPAAEIVRRIMAEAEAAIDRVSALRAKEREPA